MSVARRQSRSRALQILYQLDMNSGLTPGMGMGHFQDHFSQERTPDPFMERLVCGVAQHLADLDKQIATVAEHWRPERMAVVDRNLLRLGLFELNFCDDIPSTVTINEMIEIAKEFGAESSPAFVNGILDKIRATLNRPEKAQ